MKKTISVPFDNEKDALRAIRVRPIQAHEQPQWEKIIEQEHYLGHARMVGSTLRYVAELDGEWIALIGWGASAYHLRDRDEWIGWDSDTRRCRLNLIVGNNRFLCRIDRGEIPNVPSRVLSLVLKRLGDDWQNTYGYRPLLAETFVDIASYAGTCYKASNWLELGITAGYAKSRADYYEAHDKPKRLFVRELEPGAREKLNACTLPAACLPGVVDAEPKTPLQCADYVSLFELFKSVDDPRHHNKKYKINTLLAIAAGALLSGQSSYEGLERFSRRLTKAQCNRLRCPKNKDGSFRTPCANTFINLFDQLDHDLFDQLLGRWLSRLTPAQAAVLAVDGKVIRSMRKKDGSQGSLLAVFHHEGGVVNQVEICQGDEIESARRALCDLPLDDVLVTGDALHTQVETARQIVQEQGGDYLFCLKGNQSGVRERAKKIADQTPADFFLTKPKQGTVESNVGGRALSR
jgi:hypothetical protein